jgi:hypothetical protein
MEQLEEVVAEVAGSRLYEGGYSGRFMFGKKCYGIVCSNATEVIEAAASRGLKGARFDNLGHDFIVYWPSMEYKPE